MAILHSLHEGGRPAPVRRIDFLGESDSGRRGKTARFNRERSPTGFQGFPSGFMTYVPAHRFPLEKMSVRSGRHRIPPQENLPEKRAEIKFRFPAPGENRRDRAAGRFFGREKAKATAFTANHVSPNRQKKRDFSRFHLPGAATPPAFFSFDRRIKIISILLGSC